MSTVKDRIAVYGEYNFHKEQKSMCQTFKKQIRGNSKIETSYNG